jgi:putative phage-type endonuclease
MDLAEYVRARFEKYGANAAVLGALIEIPIIEQKSAEWHRVRQTIVTASDFAQALGDGKFGTQLEFLQKKAGYKQFPFDANCPPLKWGVMLEDVACAIYERRNSAKVLPFGLLKHPSIEHFGASPDGITELGVMVEIKCPYRRKITNEVPRQYYYQIQGQLDVCGLDECDFLECEFQRVMTEAELKDIADAREIGCIFEVFDTYANETKYVYSAIHTSDEASHAALVTWAAATEAEIKRDARLRFVEKHLWFLEFTNTIRVYKDPDFLDRKLKDLETVWNKVLSYRADKALYDSDMLDAEQGKPPKKTPKAISEGGTTKAGGGMKATCTGQVTMTGFGFLADD